MNQGTWSADKTLLLPDGRSIGYRTHGDRSDVPLIFMHGTPGSRLVLSESDPLAQVDGIFLVTPERPGYGLSTPQSGRTLASWASDVAALADHLGLSTYSVAGISGGAPYALACAFYSSSRVSMVFLMSSPAPTSLRASRSGMSLGNRLGLWAHRFLPALPRLAIETYAKAYKTDPDAFLQRVTAQLSAPDKLLMCKPQFRDAVSKDLHEAYRQGSDAQFRDSQLVMTAPTWGFPLSAVAVPVFAWHGSEDSLIPVSAAWTLRDAIPSMTLVVVPNAGHLLTEDVSVINGISAILMNCGPARSGACAAAEHLCMQGRHGTADA